MSKARDLASAAPAPAGVTSTELGYVDGVTSAIQTQLDAKTAKDTLTTTGDIYYASAANTPARLGIGTASQLLAVNSGATAPEWVAAPSSGGMTLISETTASGLTSLSLSSIPQTYKDLLLVWQGITQSSGSRYGMRLNNNSSSIYHEARMGGADSTFTGVTIGATNQVESSSTIFGDSLGATAARMLRGSMTIYNYASTTRQKSIEANWAWQKAADEKNYITLQTVFATTTAVTSIDIFRDFGSGTFSNTADTSIRLYGIS